MHFQQLALQMCLTLKSSSFVLSSSPLLYTLFLTENKGKFLLTHEESSLNIPAIGAAHVLKRYVAQAPDELSLEVSS